MGVLCYLRMASDDDLAMLLNIPGAMRAYPGGVTDGAWPAAGSHAIYLDRETSIDKAWHGLHFLFTGMSDGGKWPEGFLLAGGTAIGKLNVGYGPDRAFRSSEVVEINLYLRTLDHGQLA
jgi:hypothetical protein